ncbi:MAG TPA: zinc ribbon domain-containing protein [Candidatus Lokiarchaeia archaeon]|nr:zinc ribbon domain-containing protein [Candidatus Lokiarchaeia archaeon]
MKEERQPLVKNAFISAVLACILSVIALVTPVVQCLAYVDMAQESLPVQIDILGTGYVLLPNLTWDSSISLHSLYPGVTICFFIAIAGYILLGASIKPSKQSVEDASLPPLRTKITLSILGSIFTMLVPIIYVAIMPQTVTLWDQDNVPLPPGGIQPLSPGSFIPSVGFYIAIASGLMGIASAALAQKMYTIETARAFKSYLDSRATVGIPQSNQASGREPVPTVTMWRPAAATVQGPAPAMMPAFCSSCGSELVPGLRFCPKCGARL